MRGNGIHDNREQNDCFLRARFWQLPSHPASQLARTGVASGKKLATKLLIANEKCLHYFQASTYLRPVWGFIGITVVMFSHFHYGKHDLIKNYDLNHPVAW